MEASDGAAVRGAGAAVQEGPAERTADGLRAAHGASLLCTSPSGSEIV